ncbi:MAG: rod shape-determining protein RodA [Christensenellaceae bacterium]|jgi:rod shape determining protein RodA|nr:rod shape-determining protein RodA [Christensenellaceae bacterium]
MLNKDFLKQIDWVTIVLMLILVAIGLISIASITAEPFSGKEAALADYVKKLNLYYVQKQAVNFLVGLAVFLIVIAVDYKVYKYIIRYAYIAIVALLCIVFVTTRVRGIQGWFQLGFIDRALQPGELCKICIIIALSQVVSTSMDRTGRLSGIKTILFAMLLVLIPSALVMAQPDFGTAFVYVCIMVFIFFIGRISWGYIAAAAGALAVAAPLAYFYLLSDLQKGRIQVFLDPTLDLQDAGYNVSQAKLAIGSGQLSGKGFFTEGTLAQLRFVPERHTDFIYAGIVEGLGFIGGALIIVLYFTLLFRWLYIAIKTKDSFASCLVIGVCGMMAAHVFENIGMTIGLVPVTGIPLPFISYGGSNLLTNMIGVGIVENIWIRRPKKRRSNS